MQTKGVKKQEVWNGLPPPVTYGDKLALIV